MVDLVYPLGKGSRHDDFEIRFSLRSVEKNLRGVGKIWVVGECPEFLKDVEHIECKDSLFSNADGNIINKVKEALLYDVSDPFLFMNDDHFIMNPIDIEKIPSFHKGDFENYKEDWYIDTVWRVRAKQTRDILKKNGHTTFNYDIHTPILMNRDFTEVISKYDYTIPFGYCIKSLYANTKGVKGTLLNGEKIVFRGPDNFHKADSKIFMSCKDDAITNKFAEYMFNKFSEPSKWENLSGITMIALKPFDLETRGIKPFEVFQTDEKEAKELELAGLAKRKKAHKDKNLKVEYNDKSDINTF
jgi:hypothetical protein